MKLLFLGTRNDVRHEYIDHEYHGIDLEHLEALNILRTIIGFASGDGEWTYATHRMYALRISTNRMCATLVKFSLNQNRRESLE